MFIDALTQADALPALEATMQFAARRHTLIAHNIANLSTPNFQPVDVRPSEFQAALGDAIDRRRDQFGGDRGALNLRDTRSIHFDRDRGVQLHPKPAGRNILFHDRNNRDLERLMQDLVENTGVYRTASELMRRQFNLLEGAMRDTN